MRPSSRWTTASAACWRISTRRAWRKNTIVVYTSDQGFFLGDHGLFDKRFMYEESIRMPFLVRWPAGIKPGTKSDAMALNIDFAPTFLEAAGLPRSAEMQGRSLLPVLRGRTPPIGARRCTTATTTIPAITTPAPTTACGPARTS